MSPAKSHPCAIKENEKVAHMPPVVYEQCNNPAQEAVAPKAGNQAVARNELVRIMEAVRLSIGIDENFMIRFPNLFISNTYCLNRLTQGELGNLDLYQN